MQTIGARVIKNSASQGLTYLARFGSTFLVTVFIARFAGAEKLGIYSFALTFAAAAAVLTDLGISLMLIRAIARKPQAVQKYVNNSFALSVALSPLFALVSAGMINLLGYPQEVISAVYWSAIALILYGFTTLLRGAFFAYERMEFETVTTIIQEVSFLGGSLVALQLDLPFVSIFILYAVSRLLGLICSWAIYNKYIGVLRLEVDLRFWKMLILDALPFAANVILTILHVRSATFLLSYLVGNTTTGHYEAAFNISFRWSILAQILNNSLLPIMSRTHSSATEKAVDYAEQAIRYLVMLGLPLTVGLVLLASRVVTSIYGTNFGTAVVVFQILMVTIVFKFASHTLGTTLTAIDLQNKRVLALALVAILNVWLNLALIPSYGAVGAAVTASFTEVILFIAYLLFVYKRVGNPLRFAYIWKPAVGAVIMGGVIILLWQLPLIPLISLALLVYGAVLWGLKGFSSEELQTIRLLLNAGGRAPLAAFRRRRAPGQVISSSVTDQDK